MPKVRQQLPTYLEPYAFFGVEINHRSGDKQAFASECPFCGREGGKFTVEVDTGKFHCFRCHEGNEKGGGNVRTFYEKLWELSYERTSAADYEALAADRGLLSPDTPRAWGAAVSLLTREWLLPAYSAEGRLESLYRYAESGGKRVLLAPPKVDEHGHRLFGVQLFDPEKAELFLCEGPWDGMALWETLRSLKDGPNGWEMTGSPDGSLLAGVNVVAAPGASSFPEAWLSLFKGKRVALMYDNDYPMTDKRTGKVFPPAGWEGTRRAAAALLTGKDPPEYVQVLKWGEEGYDPTRPHGTDLRDVLKEGEDAGERGRLLQEVMDKLTAAPADWVGPKNLERVNGRPELVCLPCDAWGKLVNEWRKAMTWTEGLDRALSVMMACSLSTKLKGDQLWVMIIGPPSCGKSVLCEAMSVNKRYVIAKSTIRGFHSGFGRDDFSLIQLANEKTLITKDGDTLLQSPNRDQILAEARDVYDRASRTHYRTGVDRNYEHLSITWILCGTSSLRELDTSELGERFVVCVIVEDMEEELERDIGWRIAVRAASEMNSTANGTVEGVDSPTMTKAKQLTGGYINYLRQNAEELVSAVEFPEWAMRKCQLYAEFVSFIRARPSKKQQERVERELSFRLISQLVRLAKSLAVVLNKTEVDGEVLRRVRTCARNTCRGRTFEIVRHLQRAGESGMEAAILGRLCNETTEGVRALLNFLAKISVVERFNRKLEHIKGTIRWRLADRITRLYDEVMSEEEL